MDAVFGGIKDFFAFIFLSIGAAFAFVLGVGQMVIGLLVYVIPFLIGLVLLFSLGLAVLFVLWLVLG